MLNAFRNIRENSFAMATARAVMMLAVCCAALVCARTVAASQGRLLSSDYLFAPDSILHPNEIQSSQWTPFISESSRLAPKQDQSLWLRFVIEQTDSSDSLALSFDKIFTQYQLFKDGRIISSFGIGQGYAGLPPHIIPLPQGTGQQTYYMKTNSLVTRIGPVGKIKVGNKEAFVLNKIEADVITFFVVSCLGLLTFAGLILYSLYRNVSTYLFLALFSLSGLLYQLSSLQSRMILGISPAFIGNAGYIGLYCAPLFFIEFYRRIFSLTEVNLFLKAMTIASRIFPVAAVLISFTLPAGLLSALPFFYILAVPLFTGILVHSVTVLRSHSYSKTFYAGFCLLLVSGLWEVANELRFISSNLKVVPIGLLCFYLALTAMQGQFFAQLFRTAKTNAENEAIAKQRLQRVLECTNILAQSRNYKALFEAVSKNISSELQIASEAYTIDFLFSDIKASTDDTLSDTLHHFTYEVGEPDAPGTLREVIGNQEHSTRSEPSDKLTSLPGVQAAGSIDAQSDPSTTLTVPIDFGVFYGAVVVRKYGKSIFSISEREEFISFINSIAAALLISLKNIDYISEVKKKAQLDSQMDAARAQQFALLPVAPNLGNVSFVSFSRSAGKTGGDWHDCFFDEINQRLFVTVGDVTGHDFASSIITGVAAGAVRAWRESNRNRSVDAATALQEVAGLTNRVICQSSQGLKFMTMLFVCLEVQTGQLHIINAGHPHPFHFTPHNRPSTIAISGHILGQSPEHTYTSETLHLESGDQIFIYTDGLFDNEDARGEKLKRRTFVNFWNEQEQFEAKFNEFVESTNNSWGQTALEDDVTLVMLGWTNPASKSIDAA